MKFLLAIPSIFEATPIFKLARRKAKLGASASISDNVVATVCGIGCEKSQERLKEALEKYSPDCVILLGYCGACANSICSGDFVFSTEDKKLVSVFQKQGMKQVKFACVAKTASAQEKELLAERGFDAVEMESDFFEPIVKSKSACFVHIRCVSDAKNSPLPEELMDSTMDRQTGAIDPLKMLSPKRIVRNPVLIVKLIKFAIEIAPVQKFFAEESKRLVAVLNSFKTDI